MNRDEFIKNILKINKNRFSYILDEINYSFVISILQNEFYNNSVNIIVNYLLYSYCSSEYIGYILNKLDDNIVINVINRIYDYDNIINIFLNINIHEKETRYIESLNELTNDLNKKTLSTIFNNISNQTILNMFNIFTDDTITTIFNKLSPHTTIRIITIKPDLKKYITNDKIYNKLFEYKIKTIMLLKRLNLDIVSENILKFIY